MRPEFGHVLTAAQTLSTVAVLGITIYVTADSKNNDSQGVFKHSVRSNLVRIEAC
jgi:hypothetical protein